MCDLGPEHRIIGQPHHGTGTIFPELFVNNPTRPTRPGSIRDVQNLSRSVQPQDNSLVQTLGHRHRTAQHQSQVFSPKKLTSGNQTQKFVKPNLTNNMRPHVYQETIPRPHPHPNYRRAQDSRSGFKEIQWNCNDASKIQPGLAYDFSEAKISKKNRFLLNPKRDQPQMLPRLVVDSSFHLKQKINKNKWFMEGMDKEQWKSVYNTSMKRLEELNARYIEGKN
jgi:hypothetical protein